MRRYFLKYIWRFTCERLKLSWGLDCSILNLLINFICSYMCCWTVNSPLTQAQGAQCHSFSSVWEALEWSVEQNVVFQHLFMHLWILLACLASCLYFLIISVLSWCKNNILIEVLQRVLCINFWASGCRVMFFEKPSSHLECCHAVQHSSDLVMSWDFYNLFIPFLFPAIFLALEGLRHTLAILLFMNGVTNVSAKHLNEFHQQCGAWDKNP